MDLRDALRLWDFASQSFVEVLNDEGKVHCLTGPAVYNKETGVYIFAIDGVLMDFSIWIKRVELSDKEKTILILQYG